MEYLDIANKIEKWQCWEKVLSDASFFESSKFDRNFENFGKFRNFENLFEGGAPALRVIRAGTKLTVHRSLPCRAGGKPSTGFPPETRKAESSFTSHHQYAFMERHPIQNFWIEINSLIFYLFIVNCIIFNIFENKISKFQILKTIIKMKQFEN